MTNKLLILSILLLSLTSFKNFNFEENYTKKLTIAVDQDSEGQKLIAKMDCVGCHKVDKKLVGPSYVDIAQKYPLNAKNISYLADKIIKGGSGVWGTVPMAAHSTLKKDDAKLIAKYILSLNK